MLLLEGGPSSLSGPAGRRHRGLMTVIDAEAFAAIADGRRANCDFSVRPIAPSDADALVRFHEQLSDQTIRLRYFNLHRNLAPDEVAHLTCVDGFNRVAYVVERKGEIVGVGRYDRCDQPCRAEVAFVVADEFQHHGLGPMLFERLVETAKLAGIGEFCASVLAENATMLAVFHSAGFPFAEERFGDVVELTMEIGPSCM
jgi:GNAT superfamily N-acetyltransferase